MKDISFVELHAYVRLILYILDPSSPLLLIFKWQYDHTVSNPDPVIFVLFTIGHNAVFVVAFV